MKYFLIRDDDDDIESEHESLLDAVLAAARYDGWGASFERDVDGRMGLRCSDRHIGNNPWIPSGYEKPAYGYSSDQEDDQKAIEEIASQIYADQNWGQNMKGLKIKTAKELVSEQSIRGYIACRIESGDLPVDDLVTLAVRFGLKPPHEFLMEMFERMYGEGWDMSDLA